WFDPLRITETTTGSVTLK
uniref:Argininosuccinate synthase, chloroplastic (Fragments) n=1 Tax=Pseudotsuga menziesii TaxID=3357 RepID=ASSY_PSEMZ|nr:RecName: Full=Argininosuccinate synthase, chloroplastic; AltName: Full=Citrulline--aspartate ligase [Pseudotsuga menziesii]